ncbi:hypothetical protein SAMN05216271_1271 [Halopseudomonas sabulinigri]|uniref:Uncharacterized protein n=1 Tax=Halopseudomonas sabulinigri TaxID=472181 RepID=A0A1H1PUZ3_9GAMM|nr:hypothetical protein [Halopseudomonas sabulinigri]SDS15010.1 hypothetical protein SAMN05216271_1271 [Halopseudomonas sabulinigri]
MIAEAQFNRATLDCMTSLRRHIKRSLGVTVRLGDPDAVESMIGLSKDCPFADIRELGSRLAEMVAPPAPVAEDSMVAQGAIAARQYQAPAQRGSSTAAEPAPAASSGSVRIYRGQVIR